jgi:hypothetical protein
VLLVGPGGELLEVVSVERGERRAAICEFEVEGWHTYRVSETEQDPAVWVHNICEGAYRQLGRLWDSTRKTSNAGLATRIEGLAAEGSLYTSRGHAIYSGNIQTLAQRLRSGNVSAAIRGDALDIAMKGMIRRYQRSGHLTRNVRVNPTRGLRGEAGAPDIFWSTRNVAYKPGMRWIDMTGRSAGDIAQHFRKTGLGGEAWTPGGQTWIRRSYFQEPVQGRLWH